MKEKVILYDNNEAWIIEKHETNHINKDCKFFSFDGFLRGCLHELDNDDPVLFDGNEYVKYLFRNCNKNCKWKKSKNHISLKEGIELLVNNLKSEHEKYQYCYSEIDRLEIKKTIMKNKKTT